MWSCISYILGGNAHQQKFATHPNQPVSSSHLNKSWGVQMILALPRLSLELGMPSYFPRFFSGLHTHLCGGLC